MLLLRHILKDRVEINSPFRFLYGFKLNTGIEKYLPLPEKIANLLLKLGISTRKIEDQILIFAFYRKKLRNTDVYTNELYLFTFSSRLRDFVKSYLPSYKQLNGVELANALYRLHTLDDDIILQKKLLKRTTEIFKGDLTKFPPVENLYKKLVLNAFSKRDLVAYVGASLDNIENVDYKNLLLIDWEGVLWITFQFADFSSFLKGKELKSSGRDKVLWKTISEKYKTKLHLVGFESYLIGEKKKLPVSLALTIMSFIGFTPKEKKVDKEKLLSETPLKYFDVDYEFVDDIRYVRKLLPTSLEKYKIAKEPLFAGINRFRTYTNYSPFEDCTSPHAIAIAPTGSGKSVFLGLTVKHALGIELKDLIKTTVRPQVENVMIRYFDKGYTAEILFKLLELRGLDVFRFSTKPSKIRINPCEIQDEETDFDFSVQHISAILKSMGLEGLKGGEIIIYKIALKEVYNNDSYKYVLGLRVRDLKHRSEKLYNRLKKEGFEDNTILKEIVNQDPQKYWFLNQPIISDVLRFLRNEAKYSSLFENKEEVYRTIEKLSKIENLEEFRFLGEVDIKQAKFIYIDLDPLADSQFFVPIVMGLLKKIIHYDKYQKDPNVKAYYFFDEAHTMLRYEEFAKAIETSVREVRKFNISMTFATQNWKEIPPQVITNICTRYFLTPSKEESGNINEAKKEILIEYVKHLGLEREDVKDLEELYMELGNYFIATMTDNALFSTKIPPTNLDLEVLNAKNPYFLLESEKIAIVRERRLKKEEKERLENLGYVIF